MTLTPSYDSGDNAYTIEHTMTGDGILYVKLPSTGRLAIRKSNGEGLWPVVLMSPLADVFSIYIFGDSEDAVVRFQTSCAPSEMNLYNV